MERVLLLCDDFVLFEIWDELELSEVLSTLVYRMPYSGRSINIHWINEQIPTDVPIPIYKLLYEF